MRSRSRNDGATASDNGQLAIVGRDASRILGDDGREHCPYRDREQYADDQTAHRPTRDEAIAGSGMGKARAVILSASVKMTL